LPSATAQQNQAIFTKWKTILKRLMPAADVVIALLFATV